MPRKSKQAAPPGTRARDAEGFTAKERLFVVEYMVDLNGTQAAIRAGYSKKSAKNYASLLMSYPHIRKAIDNLMKLRITRIDVTADKVVAELGKIGFAAFGDKDVSTSDKKAALDSLCRHLGLFKDKLDMGIESKTEVRIKFV